MIYVFCDEYVERDTPDWRYRYSSVAFLQGRFKTGISKIRNLRGVIVTVTAPIPEPSTMLLLGSGLIGLVGFRRKFKKS